MVQVPQHPARKGLGNVQQEQPQPQQQPLTQSSYAPNPALEASKAKMMQEANMQAQQAQQAALQGSTGLAPQPSPEEAKVAEIASALINGQVSMEQLQNSGIPPQIVSAAVHHAQAQMQA